MLLPRLCTPVALLMLLWSSAVLGQDIRALSVDHDHAVGYTSGSSEAAGQRQTVLDLTTELKRLLQQFGPGKVPQILDQQTVSTADSKTPVRFRFRVGMFVEGVTETMISLFSDYQRGPKCDKALVQNLEDELNNSKGANGGVFGVFGQKIAAIKQRCNL